MSKLWQPNKPTVELQESRIRRDPAQADKRPTLVKLEARSREWEIALAIAGMILFAVAMNLLWLGLNSYIFR